MVSHAAAGGEGAELSRCCSPDLAAAPWGMSPPPLQLHGTRPCGHLIQCWALHQLSRPVSSSAHSIHSPSASPHADHATAPHVPFRAITDGHWNSAVLPVLRALSLQSKPRQLRALMHFAGELQRAHFQQAVVGLLPVPLGVLRKSPIPCSSGSTELPS